MANINFSTVRTVRFIIVQLSGWKNAGVGAEMGSPAFYVKPPPRDKLPLCVCMQRTVPIVQINEDEVIVEIK